MHARTFVGDELEVEAHGREREKEVGEDDGGVDAEVFGGGDGDLGGERGCAADFEERVFGADGAILRHVAAGLAEEPDGSAVNGPAEAGTNEAAALGPGSRIRLDYRVSVRGLRRCGRRPIWPLGISAWGHSSIWPIESDSIQRPSLVAGVRGGLGCGERGGLARIALGFAQCGLLQTLSVASGARPAELDAFAAPGLLGSGAAMRRR